jgi:hypothetical protein
MAPVFRFAPEKANSCESPRILSDLADEKKWLRPHHCCSCSLPGLALCGIVRLVYSVQSRKCTVETNFLGSLGGEWICREF